SPTKAGPSATRWTPSAPGPTPGSSWTPTRPRPCAKNRAPRHERLHEPAPDRAQRLAPGVTPQGVHIELAVEVGGLVLQGPGEEPRTGHRQRLAVLVEAAHGGVHGPRRREVQAGQRQATL